MIKNLEGQKAKIKEKINAEIDGYFEKLENAAKEADFDINILEKLMLENEERVRTIYNETNSEAASNVETSIKKVFGMRQGNRKSKKRSTAKGKNNVRGTKDFKRLLLLPGLWI